MIGHFRKLAYLSAVSLSTFLSSLHAQDVACGLDLSCEPTSCPSFECCKWSIRGDLLYWKARASNVNFIADYERFATNSNNEYRIKSKSLNFDRNFGFRLGLNYKKPCSCWDLGFLWTHFCTNAHGRPDREKCLNLSDAKVEYDTDTKWKLHLNFWDFDAVRTFCVGDCVAIRAWLSVRGAGIKQEYWSENEYFTNANGNLEDFYEIHEEHKFYGAGPRIGVEANWLLGCGWSLYGEAAAAFLVGYSEHKVCDHLLLDNPPGISATINEFEQIFERDECLQANRVITDLEAGIRWNACLRDCCYNLIFQLGWDYHTIFGQKHAHFGRDFILQDPFQFQFPVERNTGPCKSTLAVYGVNFSVTLEF